MAHGHRRPPGDQARSPYGGRRGNANGAASGPFWWGLCGQFSEIPLPRSLESCPNIWLTWRQLSRPSITPWICTLWGRSCDPKPASPCCCFSLERRTVRPLRLHRRSCLTEKTRSVRFRSHWIRALDPPLTKTMLPSVPVGRKLPNPKLGESVVPAVWVRPYRSRPPCCWSARGSWAWPLPRARRVAAATDRIARARAPRAEPRLAPLLISYPIPGSAPE